jgi:hypothetical protein
MVTYTCAGALLMFMFMLLLMFMLLCSMGATFQWQQWGSCKSRVVAVVQQQLLILVANKLHEPFG